MIWMMERAAKKNKNPAKFQKASSVGVSVPMNNRMLHICASEGH
jgi:hypothetical protein